MVCFKCIKKTYKFFLFCYILVLPYINPLSFDGDANFADSVQLTCHVAKGDLPMKISWLFNSQPIFAHSGIVTTKIGDRSSFLTVPSVTAENRGIYTCVAVNAGGTFNHSATLNVHGSFYILIVDSAIFFLSFPQPSF